MLVCSSWSVEIHNTCLRRGLVEFQQLSEQLTYQCIRKQALDESYFLLCCPKCQLSTWTLPAQGPTVRSRHPWSCPPCQRSVDPWHRPAYIVKKISFHVFIILSLFTTYFHPASPWWSVGLYLLKIQKFICQLSANKLIGWVIIQNLCRQDRN